MADDSQENIIGIKDIRNPSGFCPESREGFYVSEMMKRYWAAQLRVLSEIDAICARHDIPWYADNGSLLGAVRHGGYIPWDDDLDIVMMRHDMNRFLQIAKKELPSGYCVLDLFGEKEYTNYLPRITNARVIDYSEEHLAAFYGCPFTVGVDLFPLDGLYEDNEAEEERAQKAYRSMKEAEAAAKKGDAKTCRAKMLETERLFAARDSATATHVALMPFWVEKRNHRYDKAWYAHRVYLPFEHVRLPVPARYDEVLKTEYGDYMRIVKSGGIHEYPVYDVQEEAFRRATGKNAWRYTWDKGASLPPVRSLPEKKDGEKKEIVFLPVRADWWKTMEPYYREASADRDCHAVVIVPPYIAYEPDGSDPRIVKEADLFPEDIPLTDAASYDFGAHRPDMIFIQDPYDTDCNAVTLPDFFVSSRLRQLAGQLVCIPCHDLYTPEEGDGKALSALSVLIEQPASAQSDRILLPDETMRGIYIDTLTRLAGEETRARWEEVCVCTTPEAFFATAKEQPDAEAGDRQPEDAKLPRRKTLLWHLTIAFLLANGTRAIDKYLDTIDIFRAHADRIRVLLVPHPALRELDRMDGALAASFASVREQFQKADIGEIIETKDLPQDLSGIDAFYGDASVLAHRCRLQKIPVMIEAVL